MTMRAAVLGAGGMGSLHAENLNQMEGVLLSAVCDTEEAAAGQLASKYGAAAYTDFSEMLKNEKLDLLLICLPPFAHHGEAEQAARRGLHLFVEKPIDISSANARKTVEFVERTGVCTQVGYHCRFGGAVRELRSRIESGKAGRPVLFQGRYECNSLHSSWWRSREKCGSQLLEQAIHTYDMAIYLMGKPVFAAGQMANLCHKETPGYTIEDVSVSIIRFENGALGAISATNCAVPGKWKNPFTAVFENLTVDFSDPNHAVFYDHDGDTTVETHVDCETNLYLAELEAFVEAVRTGKKSLCPLSQGYESLHLVEQVSNRYEEEGR